jgi:hypothetical protein
VACRTIIKGHWKAITQHFGTIEAIASFQMIEDLCPFICRESRNVIRTFNLNFEIAQQLQFIFDLNLAGSRAALSCGISSCSSWASLCTDISFSDFILGLVSEIIWPKYQHTMMLYPQSLQIRWE